MNNVDVFGNKVHPSSKKFGTGFCCGVEHEVENVDWDRYENVAPKMADACGYQREDDGSLIAGTEFITFPASLANQIAFHKVLHGNELFEGEPFSERTSTHVHVNVSQLSVEQTLSLLQLYALAEPYFFAFVGETRERNIHCVPLWATQMGGLLFKHNYTYTLLPQQWHKYTALNIKPMKEIGTIEFRHLYGTEDTTIFANWLALLKSLYTWALEDNGKFYSTTCRQLLEGGYPQVCSFLENLNCPLGKLLEIIRPHVNQERLQDVVILATTEAFGGLSNWKNYIKAVA